MKVRGLDLEHVELGVPKGHARGVAGLDAVAMTMELDDRLLPRRVPGAPLRGTEQSRGGGNKVEEGAS